MVSSNHTHKFLTDDAADITALPTLPARCAEPVSELVTITIHKPLPCCIEFLKRVFRAESQTSYFLIAISRQFCTLHRSSCDSVKVVVNGCPRGVLPSSRLLGMCRWMGSHFHSWTDYNGVTFLVELLEWGRTFSGFLG